MRRCQYAPCIHSGCGKPWLWSSEEVALLHLIFFSLMSFNIDHVWEWELRWNPNWVQGGSRQRKRLLRSSCSLHCDDREEAQVLSYPFPLNDFILVCIVDSMFFCVPFPLLLQRHFQPIQRRIISVSTFYWGWSLKL